MHMVSQRDLNSAELETMRTTVVMTAKSAVQTREEDTVYVKEKDLFVSTSSSSSSQDSVFDINRYTENPVLERSGSTSGGATGKPAAQKKTETENKKKMDAKKYKAIYYCMTCRTGCRSSENIWSMKVVL